MHSPLSIVLSLFVATSCARGSTLAPNLEIPQSDVIIKVQMIDTTTRIKIPTSLFISEDITGAEWLNTTSQSYLLQHPSGRKFLFDLGMRPDWHNLAPYWTNSIEENGWNVSAQTDVKSILAKNGINPKSIESIILSHWHFDHMGNPSEWPDCVSLIVGPGFHTLMPGYPVNSQAVILESDYSGRQMKEVSFNQSLKLGQFDAIDFFNDGSMYLLNTPGHAVGHISALVRVSKNPDSFLFLAGDLAHHGGEMRPSTYHPLPDEILPNPINRTSKHPCPGELFGPILRNGSTTSSIYTTQSQSRGINANATQTQETLIKALDFDASAEVFFMFAHDRDLLTVVDQFPKYANHWKTNNWAEEERWMFLSTFAEAVGQ